jgi:hypothetical protein
MTIQYYRLISIIQHAERSKLVVNDVHLIFRISHATKKSELFPEDFFASGHLSETSYSQCNL